MTPDGRLGDLLPDTSQAVRRPHLVAPLPPARDAIGQRPAISLSAGPGWRAWEVATQARC